MKYLIAPLISVGLFFLLFFVAYTVNIQDWWAIPTIVVATGVWALSLAITMAVWES